MLYVPKYATVRDDCMARDDHDWAAARKSGQNVHTNCMGKASRGAA
jgi:hypothetical protein